MSMITLCTAIILAWSGNSSSAASHRSCGAPQTKRAKPRQQAEKRGPTPDAIATRRARTRVYRMRKEGESENRKSGERKDGREGDQAGKERALRVEKAAGSGEHASG
eukprot:6194872-Pleurochrysis_carterae.AAC.2